MRLYEVRITPVGRVTRTCEDDRNFIHHFHSEYESVQEACGMAKEFLDGSRDPQTGEPVSLGTTKEEDYASQEK